MKSKEDRIIELEKQILEIKNEAPINYVLLSVSPDCGGGIQDRTTDLAISTNKKELIEYSKEKFNYTPIMEKRNPNEEIVSHCNIWYKLAYSTIQILGGSFINTQYTKYNNL